MNANPLLCTSRVWPVLAAAAVALCGSVAVAEDAADSHQEPTSVQLELYGDLFTEYRNERREDGPNGDAFELQRALVGVEGSVGLGVASLEVESTRSVSPQSSFGIDGNALVLRVRRAEAGVEATGELWRVRAVAGVVRHGWVASTETGYRLRGMSEMVSERAGFVDPGDVGATAELGLWSDRLVVGAQLVNGEGRSDVERNDGKSVIGYARGRVLALDVHRGPLWLDLHVFGQEGSVGGGSARAHRLGTALTFVGPCPSAGLEWVRAWGVDDDASRVGMSFGAWAESRIATRWIGVHTRYDRIWTDVAFAEAKTHRTTVGLFSDLVEVDASRGRAGLRAYAAYELERSGDRAGDVAGVQALGNASRVRLVVELRGRGTVLGSGAGQ
jgi:hypothetical protein